ncbi:MAG: glycosyltransferase family 1 protein [Bacteroidetes bacterium]|nr:MAG: glycosyltransferase family 1 protein [Bacteroidota bacterium]
MMKSLPSIQKNMETSFKKVAYLSGAPRVSTRPEAGAAGPRSHVLGVMNAFYRLGWDVQSFIVGDRVPLDWVRGEISASELRQSQFKRVGADLMRIGMGWLNSRKSWNEIGPVNLVYERYGAFQALGWRFKRQGIPWILETNALLSLESTKDRSTVALGALLRRHERWAYHKCDVLVCISQPLAELISRETGVSSEKIIVLPNGVDVFRLDPEKARPVRIFDGPTIGFVGQLEGWQRLDLLLDAMVHLREEGVYYSLVVVGEGEMQVAWKQHADSLGLSESVYFVGAVPWDDVPSYIAGFDLGYAGAMPLAAGSMYLSPLKLYEYAAMGKPVVTAAYADALHLVRDGVAGYLFEPGGSDSIKEALRAAWAERDRWKAMGQRTRAIVVEKHSWEARLQVLLSEVQRIQKEKGNNGKNHPARNTG